MDLARDRPPRTAAAAWQNPPWGRTGKRETGREHSQGSSTTTSLLPYWAAGREQRTAMAPQDNFSPQRPHDSDTQKLFFFFASYFSLYRARHKSDADLENAVTLGAHTTKTHRDPSPNPTPHLPDAPVPSNSPLLHWLELQDHLGFGILRVLPFVSVTWYNHHITHRDTHFGIRHLSHEAWRRGCHGAAEGKVEAGLCRGSTAACAGRGL